MPTPPEAFVTRRAVPADLGTVIGLLRSANLPTSGVAEHFTSFIVAESAGRIIGTIGLELYGSTALLRSAVVEEGSHGSGVGSLMFDRILDLARNEGVGRLILLTDTAEQYFRRKNFRTVERSSITGPVTQSVEFREACPSSAICMELTL